MRRPKQLGIDRLEGLIPAQSELTISQPIDLNLTMSTRALALHQSDQRAG